MIDKISHYFPHTGDERSLHIYLPDDYFHTDRHYPVMYMFDGNDLYYHRDASSGRSWALKHYMDQAAREMIIVGIEPDHSRREAEYSPYDLNEKDHGVDLEGYGKELLDWIVNDLKAMIDSRYRTEPFRETTGIGGSSMGGLLALYGFVAYNQYFSKAAILSPSLIGYYDQLLAEINQSKFSEDSQFFISYGKREINADKKLLDLAEGIAALLQDEGMDTKVFVQPNGYHTENSWRNQTATYMEYLWNKPSEEASKA